MTSPWGLRRGQGFDLLSCATNPALAAPPHHEPVLRDESGPATPIIQLLAAPTAPAVASSSLKAGQAARSPQSREDYGRLHSALMPATTPSRRAHRGGATGIAGVSLKHHRRTPMYVPAARYLPSGVNVAPYVPLNGDHS